MRVIHEYKLNVTDSQVLYLPADALVLSVADQRGDLCIWVLLENDMGLPVERRFYVFGTGNPIPDPTEKLRFIGTVQQHNGALVWHVFEGTK